MACTTLQTCGSDNVSFYQLQRIPGYQTMCNNKNLWRQLQLMRAKQPRVMIEGSPVPFGQCYIKQNGVCGPKGP